MRKSKDQIKKIGAIAVIGLVISILLEFRVFNCIENIILQRIVFLKGHRDFVINILVGCSCSAIVVIICEYFEYLRLNKALQKRIDKKLRSLKVDLKIIDEPKCLEELIKFRNEKLGEYQRENILEEEYSPFKRDHDMKEYNSKLFILNHEVWRIFFSQLDIYSHADQKKYIKYMNLVEQRPDEGIELVEWKRKIELEKASVKNSARFHEKEIYKEITALRNKIDKMLK